MTALQKLDEILRENILDLWEPVHHLVDPVDGDDDLWNLIPEHEEAVASESLFTDELVEKYGVPYPALLERLFPHLETQKAELCRLYLAIGFVLGARLSGAREAKVQELLETYRFGLKEETGRKGESKDESTQKAR